MQTQTDLTEAKVFGALRKRFPSPAWVLLPQVRNATGYFVTNTADAIAVSVWPSRGLYLVGIEIKVSRSDWLTELKKPAKAEGIQPYCKFWYIAAPKDVILPGELPPTWGWINAANGRVITPAPEQEAYPPDMLLVASILRKVSDVTVPRSDVDAMAARRAESAVHIAELDQQRAEDTAANLIERIKVFEEASGVEIAAFRPKDIGEAVKRVLAENQDGRVYLKELQRLHRQAVQAADFIGLGLKQLREANSDAIGKD